MFFMSSRKNTNNYKWKLLYVDLTWITVLIAIIVVLSVWQTIGMDNTTAFAIFTLIFTVIQILVLAFGFYFNSKEEERRKEWEGISAINTLLNNMQRNNQIVEVRKMLVKPKTQVHLHAENNLPLRLGEYFLLIPHSNASDEIGLFYIDKYEVALALENHSDENATSAWLALLQKDEKFKERKKGKNFYTLYQTDIRLGVDAYIAMLSHVISLVNNLGWQKHYDKLPWIHYWLKALELPELNGSNTKPGDLLLTSFLWQYIETNHPKPFQLLRNCTLIQDANFEDIEKYYQPDQLYRHFQKTAENFPNDCSELENHLLDRKFADSNPNLIRHTAILLRNHCIDTKEQFKHLDLELVKSKLGSSMYITLELEKLLLRHQTRCRSRTAKN
jgi:hypothetical protein